MNIGPGALVVALLAALAGCVQQGPPATVSQLPPDAVIPALHALALIQHVNATASDGTVLRGAVYLPDGTGPFSTVLRFSPYFGTSAPSVDEYAAVGADRHVLDNFTHAGIAYALFNTRGTGASEGCYQGANPQDGPDGRAVLDALANQSWSNGKLGMWGTSYDGWAIDRVLQDPPAQLLAVAPMSSIEDLWSLYTWHGAVTYSPVIQGPDWTAGVGAGTFGTIGTIVHGDVINPNPHPDRITADHLCPGSADAIARADNPTGDRDAWYAGHDNRPGIRAHPIATFVAQGYGWPAVTGATSDAGRDIHLTQIDGRWQDMPGPKRMLLGPWGHAQQFIGAPGSHVEMVRWFDHWLNEGPDVVPAGVVQYFDIDGASFNTTSWPPLGNRLDLAVGSAQLAWTGHGPSGVVPIGSHDGDALDCNDAATYTTPAAVRDAELAGAIRVNLTLASTVPDANLVVTAYVTDGTCDLVKLGTFAVTDLRHRGNLDVGKDVTPGSPIDVSIDGMPFALHLRHGQHLLFTITTGSAVGGFPILVPKPYEGALQITGGNISLPVVAGRLEWAS